MEETDNEASMKQWSDSLAPAWERHRRRLFESQRDVSEWLVDQVAPEPGDRVLELAAGPGETGFLAAERVAPDGRVISTDLGSGMVDAARRGAVARGLDNVECRTMDAQEIDLEDDSVDGVLCRYGIMLMPEPARALAGAHRVLRPGARMAYAVWGPADRNPWFMLVAMALLENGHQPPGSPSDAGGPFSLADPDAHRALVTSAGFAAPTIKEIEGAMRFDDFDDYYSLQSEVSGPIAILLATLTDEQIDAVRSSLRPLLETHRSAQGYELPTHTVAVTAAA